MTEEELKNLCNFIGIVDADISNELKQQFITEVTEKVKNPTLSNLREATKSFLLLYLLISAEEKVEDKNN